MSLFSKQKLPVPPPAPTAPTLAASMPSPIDSTPTGSNAFIRTGPTGLKRKTGTIKPTLLGGI